MSSKLTLIHASIPVKRVSPDFAGKRWIYFGTDYLKRKKWEKAVGESNEINYKQILSEFSYSLRDPFVTWSANLGREFWNDWEWWISTLATRSNLISNLYLHICYIEVLKYLVARESLPIVVVSESRELLKVIKYNFGQHIDITTSHKKYELVGKVVDQFVYVARFLAKWCRFFYKSFIEWVVARWTITSEYPQQDVVEDKHHIVIHTCIDDACIGKDGVFRDRYYPGLADYLRQQGKKVSTLIWMYNVRKKGCAEVFRWARKKHDSFIIPQDYYSPIDCIKSFVAVLKSARVPKREYCYFRELDLYPLVVNEQRLQRCNTGAAYFANYIPMFKNMRTNGIVVNKFVDTWELKMCEVPGIVGIRKFFPDSRIIAFQHGALMPKLLFANYKTVPEEHQAAPCADIGIVNSKLNARFLVSEGYPPEFIKLGPALRFKYLQKTSTVSYSGVKGILVCLPMALGGACELLEIIHDTLTSYDLPVWVKPHPMIDPMKIKERLSFSWPDRFEVVTGSMEEWLGKAAVMIASDSSTMVESVYKGIPTIVVAKGTDIDVIPLDILEENKNWELVLGKATLVNALQNALSFPYQPTIAKDFFEFDMTLLDEWL